MTNPRIIAHRGASGEAPENTLKAFRLALAQGAEGIELDVHSSADGVPVVIHDETLERTTNGTGRVDSLPLAALQALDAGEGEKIPALEEVVELVAGRVPIFIEIKTAGTGRAVAAMVERYLARGWPPGSLIVISFLEAELADLRKDYPYLPLGLNVEEVTGAALAHAAALDALSINPAQDGLTREMVELIHANGFKVYIWTVNTDEEITHAADLEADGIMSNWPARAKALVSSKGRAPHV